MNLTPLHEDLDQSAGANHGSLLLPSFWKMALVTSDEVIRFRSFGAFERDVILLDTNCISELVRAKPEPRVMEWTEAADEAMLYLRRPHGEIRKCLAALPRADRRRNWRSLGIIAGLLAATPLHHNLTVVSRNTSDFTNTRVQVVNPWEA